MASISFLSSTVKVITASGQMAALVAADAQLRAIIQEFRRDKIDDLNLLYQGLYIQAFSAYESFIRRLIIEFVEEAARRDKTLEKLSLRKGIVEHHIYQTGYALQRVFDKKVHSPLDFNLLAKNLASVSPDSAEVTLNAIVFTFQTEGLRSEGLNKAFDRIGVGGDSLWDRLATIPELQKFFGSKSARDVANQTQKYLDVAVKRRNHVAHKGDAIEAVSESDVRDLIAFFKAFNTALASVISDRL